MTMSKCGGHTGKCNEREVPHDVCGTKHCTMGPCPQRTQGARSASGTDAQIPSGGK